MTYAYLAHSASPGGDPQPYAEHVAAVRDNAAQYAASAGAYAALDGEVLQSAATQAALWHDLGKLDDENQDILHDPSCYDRRLAYNHVDAGCVALMQQQQWPAAIAVYSHHRGLPCFSCEFTREQEAVLRDNKSSVRRHIDSVLPELMRRHEKLIPTECAPEPQSVTGDPGVFYRILLSCLVDADHTDTAAHYRASNSDVIPPQLRAAERLAMLNEYVARKPQNDERDRLRSGAYQSCSNAIITGGFAACDSPVGTGKTTAVMAHMLQQAQRLGSRHIFVVVPYTSIIEQAVDAYRQALVLPGEQPEAVVAELHSRADYDSREIRHLTAMWRAPIIVTTAVAFYETIAANRPSALRRLHELPGSIICIDEAHSALPVKLLPLAWHWMDVLAREWGCYWVLSSGSLVRYWQIGALNDAGIEACRVPDLISPSLREKLAHYECDRIAYRWRPDPVNRNDLIQWVHEAPGPRLLILNTVQSAAVVAEDMATKYGRSSVEHLSTALTPVDRKRTIGRIRERLSDPRDTDWTLVATSCIEAGMDFSFRTGFRELSSLLSLVQSAGRINREGRLSQAEVWSFCLQDDPFLTRNRDLDDTRAFLLDKFSTGVPRAVSEALSTASVEDALTRDDSSLDSMKSMLRREKQIDAPEIANCFKVIDSDTVTVVFDQAMAAQIEQGQGDWQTLQQESCAVRRSRVDSYAMKRIIGDIYLWTLEYDAFLGYMRGVLQQLVQ